MANSDLRQQILISLRAEGVGEADKAREAMATIEGQAKSLAKSFGEGNVTIQEHQKQFTSLAASYKFFGDILEKFEGQYARLAEAATAASDRINAAMASEAEEARRTAEAVEAAKLKEAEAFAKAAIAHEQWLAKEEAAMAKAQAAYDAYAQKVMKAIMAAEKATADASAKINAALAEEDAAEQKHAQVVLEAEGQIERIKQRAAAAAVSNSIDTQRVSASNAKAAMLQAREQQHFMDLLHEGVEMEKTAAKATVNLASAHGQASAKTSNYGFAILSLSHAFQDMQYGMVNATNNIPLVTTSLGYGPGLAGGLMAAAVGFQIFTNHLDDFKEALGIAKKPIEELTDAITILKERIKKLEDKPVKVALDLIDLRNAKEQLGELEKARAALKQAGEGKTTFEKQAGDQFAKEFGETGKRGRDAKEAIVAKAVADKDASDPEIAKAKAEADTLTKVIAETAARYGVSPTAQDGSKEFSRMPQVARTFVGAAREKRSGLMKQIDDRKTANRDMVSDEIAAEFAGTYSGIDPSSRAALADRFRGVGDEGLAKMAERADPERLKMLDDQRKEDEWKAGRDKRNAKKVEEGTRQHQEAFDNFNRIGARFDDIYAATAKEKGRERAQDINKQVGLFDNEFIERRGPGSLDSAILGRAAQGQSKEQIQSDLSGQMRSQVAGKVPEDMVNEVADEIVKRAVDKVRAEVAGMGGGQEGVNALMAQRQEQLERVRGAAGKRANRAQASAQEMALGQEIFQGTGGALGEQGSLAAAHRAMQSMQQGANGQAAIFEAINHTLQQITNIQASAMQAQQAFAQQLGGVRRQVGQLQAQQRRGHAQRPSVLGYGGSGY